MNLYKATEQVEKLLKEFEQATMDGDLTDEQVAEFELKLNNLTDLTNDKVDGICNQIREYIAKVAYVKSEVDRLGKLKKHFESRAKSLKRFLEFILMKSGQESITTDTNKLSFRETTNGAFFEGVENLLPLQLLNKSYSVKDSETIDLLLKKVPDIEGDIQTAPKSNTDIKNFLNEVKEDIKFELDGEWFVKHHNVLYIFIEEEKKALCRIDNIKSLQIK